MRKAPHSSGLPLKTRLSSIILEKNIRQIPNEGHSTEYPAGTLKTVKVIKHKENLGNFTAKRNLRRHGD